jgi:hypothetical protein
MGFHKIQKFLSSIGLRIKRAKVKVLLKMATQSAPERQLAKDFVLGQLLCDL